MQRTFASLTPAEALRAAIAVEQRNAEVYRRFADMFAEFGDPESLEIAAVFDEMALEEQGHRSLLQEKYARAYGPLDNLFTENDLQELIEVPRLSNSNVFSSAGDVTARDRALHCALQAEISAQAFYEKLSEEASDGALRDVYKELAKMEDGHVAYLESKLESENTAK